MLLVSHYLQTAAALCREFDASVPFPVFIKHFFSQHKKYGSRDRKAISGLCYAYFRLGKLALNVDTEERIQIAWFLISSQPNKLLEAFNSQWNKLAASPQSEKLALSGQSFKVEDIAPFQSLLSAGMQAGSYASSFLVQPDVFIRTRPGKSALVISKLEALPWQYQLENNSCIRLPASSAIDTHFKMNGDLVVQDLNSQKVGDVIREAFTAAHFRPDAVWDCCAASGGKSIMIKDIYPGIKFTVSDIRPSILHNLQKRFKEAGIHQFRSFIADLSNNDNKAGQQLKKQVDFIVADVPCTGSGTWSRTPEQLYFFKEQLIDEYAAKQFAIASNALSHLAQGGYFVYITCSVFKKENEDNVSRLVETYPLKLISSKLLDGTKEKADSMFVAILRKTDRS